VSWSLGETKALAVKAAKGAKMPWGMAEEAGFAVHWLQSHGSPGVAALAAYLDWRDRSDSPHDLCPIAFGTELMDASRGVPERLGLIRQPLLLAPFIATCTPSGMKLCLGETAIVVSETGLVTDADRSALLIPEAECTAQRTAARVGDTKTRVPGSEADAMAQLGRFAARTYAPATDASRISGAGAGLSDND